MIVIGAGDGTSLILYDYNKNYNAVLTAGTSADLFWHYVDESADAARFLGNIPIGENVVVPLATEVDRAITIRAVTRSLYSNASNPLDIRNATQVSGTSTRIDAIPIIYVARPVTYKQAVIGIDNWSRFARVRKIETAWTEEALLAQVPGSGGYALRILDLDQGWDDTAETNSVESNELPDFVFISRDYTDPATPSFAHNTRFVRIAHSFESTDRATGATYLDKIDSLLFTEWSEVLEFDFATSAVTNAGGTAPAAEYSIGIPDAWPVNTLDGDGLLEVKGSEQVTATEFVPGVLNAGPTDQYIGGRKFYRQQQVFGSWAESSNNKWRPPLASDWPAGPAAVAFNAPLAAYGLGDGTNAVPGRLHFYNAFATVGAGITPEAVAQDDVLGRIASAGWVGASGFRFSGRIDFVAEDDPDATNLPVSVDIYGGKAHQATDNTGTRGLRIDSVGNAVLGVGGLAADAVGGFAWIPTLAGTPTGTPAPTHTGYTPVGFYNGAIYGWNGAAWVAAGGGSPAGSGTELQYRNGSAFGPVTGSSVTGANIGLTGEVYTTGNFKVQRTTTSTTPNGGLLVLQTMTNASYADPTAWHYGIGLQQTVNTTAASGKSAGVYSLLEMAAVPSTSHVGAAIVAGIYVPTALTFGSNRTLHGIYVDDILGSYTSIHTYYGVRVLEPTGTVTNKYGVVVEGAQKSGFGTANPSVTVHIGSGDGSTYDPPSGVTTPTCLYIADGTSGTPSTSASPAASIIRRWNATAVAGSAGALYIDLTNDKSGQSTLETLSVRSRSNQSINGDYIGIASRMVVEGPPGTNTSMFAMWALAQKMTRVDAGAAEYAFDNQYSRSISAATNASPIEITVTFAHYLTTGDEVYIADVGGNTAANGTLWTVTVVNSTKFTLDGSTGNAPYTSGGTVYLHNSRDYGTAGNRGYAASYFLGAGNSYGNATAILVIGSGDPTRTQAYTGLDIRPDSISPLTHRAIRIPNADYLSSWNADESASYHLIGLAVGNTVSLDPDGRTIYAGTGPTQITNANGTLRVAALDSAIGAPAGSGTELQHRASGTTFGAVSGSSVSGSDITLTGGLAANGGVGITRATSSTNPSASLFVTQTQINASYASSTSWYYAGLIEQKVDNTAANGKVAGLYSLLEYNQVPGSTHAGAAIVAGVYFTSNLTIGSSRPLHGLYVDDIIGSYTSVNTYYGVRILEPTGTVTNKYGLVVEGSQLSGFGTNTPLAKVHIEGGNFIQNAATNAQAQQSLYSWGTSGNLFVFHRSLGSQGSPSAVTAGTPLGQIRFNGNYDTTSITLGDEATTASVNQIGAIIMVEAAANWNGTDNPADIRFRTGTTVGVSRANAMIITADRRTVIGDAVVRTDATYAFNVKGDAQQFSDTLTQLLIQSAGDQQSTLSLISSAGTFASPAASGSGAYGGNLKFHIYNSGNALKEVARISGGLAGANGTNPDGTLIFFLRSGVAMQSFASITPSLLTVTPAATFQSTIQSTGEIYTTANFRAVRTTSSTTPSGGILIQQTNTNTSYADGTAWHYAIGLEQIVNNTAASGKVAGVYSLLEYSQVPATAHTGAAIVAGVYFTTALTIGSNKPLHGLYVDDILGSYTSINTYYGVRIIEPTGTVTNKYGLVVEGAQLSGFGTTPSATLHASGTVRFDVGSDASYDMFYRGTGSNLSRIAKGASPDGYVLTLVSGVPAWAAASGGGANTALSNLASVSINLSLIPQTTLDLGATTTAWRNLYIYGAGTFGSHSLKFHGTPTGHRTITFPDATATVATLAEVETLTNKTLGADTVFNISTTAAQTHTFTQSTADAVGVVLKFQKTRAGVVSGGDVVGDLLFQGYGGSAYYDAARIRVSIDAAAGNGDMPGFLSFHTTPNGSGTLAQAMLINSNQRVAIGPSIASGDVTSLLHVQDTTSSGRVFIAQATTGTSGNIIEAISGNVSTSYSTVFAIDRERSYALQSGNGGYLKHQYATATVNASNGASSIATSGLVPAGAVVLSVGAYVTTTFGNGNGLTTMKLGDGTTTNLYANAMARTSGTNIGLAEHLNGTFGPKFYASGMDITITANAGTFTAVGTIRIEVWYYLSDGPLQ